MTIIRREHSSNRVSHLILLLCKLFLAAKQNFQNLCCPHCMRLRLRMWMRMRIRMQTHSTQSGELISKIHRRNIGARAHTPNGVWATEKRMENQFSNAWKGGCVWPHLCFNAIGRALAAKASKGPRWKLYTHSTHVLLSLFSSTLTLILILTLVRARYRFEFLRRLSFSFFIFISLLFVSFVFTVFVWQRRFLFLKLSLRCSFFCLYNMINVCMFTSLCVQQA